MNIFAYAWKIKELYENVWYHLSTTGFSLRNQYIHSWIQNTYIINRTMLESTDILASSIE